MLKISIFPYIDLSAYRTPDNCSDFQLDMIRHGLAQLPDIQVQQFPENPLMSKDSREEHRNRVWGRGYTLYGLLNERKEQLFSPEESDLFIIPLHWTMTHDKSGFHRFIKDIISVFKKNTIAIDGTDFTHYEQLTAELCPYFKRELEDGPQKALPIFFAIPEEKLNEEPVKKIRDFSNMVPAMLCWNSEWGNNYHKYNTEQEYYKQYRESYFGLNIKKAGWATGRLQEICSQDCLPYWTDIEAMPKNTYHNLNRELFLEVKRLPGVHVNTINSSLKIYDTRNVKYGEYPGWIDWNKFDLNRYHDLHQQVKEHCRKDMTTKALARYILEKSL